ALILHYQHHAAILLITIQTNNLVMNKAVTLLFITAVSIMLSACTSEKNNQPAISAGTALLKDTLNISTAQRLVRNFDARAYHIKHGELEQLDTRCVWFSLDQLKALVANIEKEDGDGIRFYSAAYDKDKKEDVKMLDTAYLEHATLVMVSTRDSAGYHADYFHKPGAGGKEANKGFIIMAVPENQGELCPPPVHCNLYGAKLLQ
ncbi:MAG: hypothetical protein ABUT20_65525, partial [Bacteroidota bacterium]